ncbi:MAG TPA: ATP-binding protein [Bacteroidales bacterium]
MKHGAGHHINKLISEGEHQQLDFKFEISDSRKIAKTLVAFANTDGGTLLVGVKDNGNIAGVRTDEEYYMLDAAAKMYCKPQINFEVRKWTMNGKTVLEVIIAKSNGAPHYAEVEPKKWLAYIRIKDENILANSIHLKVWKKRQQKRGIFLEFSEKEKLLLKYLESNPSITLSKFCKVGMITRQEGENILANLITLDLIEIAFCDQHFIYKRKGQHEKTPEPSRLSGFM